MKDNPVDHEEAALAPLSAAEIAQAIRDYRGRRTRASVLPWLLQEPKPLHLWTDVECIAYLCFVCEGVAHLQGQERSLLPVTDRVRAWLEATPHPAAQDEPPVTPPGLQPGQAPPCAKCGSHRDAFVHLKHAEFVGYHDYQDRCPTPQGTTLLLIVKGDEQDATRALDAHGIHPSDRLRVARMDEETFVHVRVECKPGVQHWFGADAPLPAAPGTLLFWSEGDNS